MWNKKLRKTDIQTDRHTKRETDSQIHYISNVIKFNLIKSHILTSYIPINWLGTEEIKEHKWRNDMIWYDMVM